jgi:hypothetical protein
MSGLSFSNLQMSGLPMSESTEPESYSQSIFLVFHAAKKDTIFECPIHATSQEEYRYLQDRLILIASSFEKDTQSRYPRNYFILGKKGVTENETPDYDRRGECIQLYKNPNCHVFMSQTLDAILPMEYIEGEWVQMTSLISKNKVVCAYSWQDMPDKDLVYFIHYHLFWNSKM